MEKLNEIKKLIDLYQHATLTLINNKRATIKDINNLSALILTQKCSYSYVLDDYCLDIRVKVA